METKVLVADSSRESQQDITRSLNKIGVDEVVQASSLAEAIELFSSNTFSIVFTEWNKAVELTKAIRQLREDVPIIVTASQEKTNQDLAEYCPGANYLLSTPVQTDELQTLEKYVLAMTA